MRLLPLVALLAVMLPGRAGAVTVRLDSSDGARVQASLHPGDIMRVDLPDDPLAGRTWAVRGSAPSALLRLGAAHRVFGGMMSSQGSSSFAWRAVSAGEGTLTLACGTANERAAGAAPRTIVIDVAVAGSPLGPEETAPPTVSQLRPEAAYRRRSPCADCTLLVEHLTLFRAPGETPFVLRRTYQDAPGGTLTAISTGSWSISRGAADPTATIYTLTGAGSPSLYRAEADRLVPLDALQIPIPSPAGMDLDFHRIDIPAM